MVEGFHPFLAGDVDQYAAGQVRLDLLDAELPQAVGALNLVDREAVVEHILHGPVPHGGADADVAGAVELGSDLTDLGREDLVEVDEGVVAEGSARGGTRDEHRVGAPLEQGNTALVHLPELVHLARLHELYGLEDLLRGYPVRAAGLVLGPPQRVRPPRPFFAGLRKAFADDGEADRRAGQGQGQLTQFHGCSSCLKWAQVGAKYRQTGEVRQYQPSPASGRSTTRT